MDFFKVKSLCKLSKILLKIHKKNYNKSETSFNLLLFMLIRLMNSQFISIDYPHSQCITNK